MTRPKAFLIHGTFAKNAAWVRSDSAISQAIAGKEVDLDTVRWTGENTFQARANGAEELIEKLGSLDPETPVAIIAHSHGGSVISYAFAKAPDKFIQVAEHVRSRLFDKL